MIRTDTEALTKMTPEYNAKTLNDFDAVLFYTGGTLDDQKSAMRQARPSRLTEFPR